MEDHNLTHEELLEALAKSQAQVNILQKALLEDSNQASESLYKEIVEGQTDMITRWMPDTTVTYVNQAYCRYFGRSAEEFIGTQFLPNLPEETQLIVKDAVVKLITGQATTIVSEEKSLDAEGKTHWIQWTYSVLRDDAGELSELQSVGRDITDLREARVALEQASAVVAHSPVVMFQRKIENQMPGEVTFISENVSRYGITPEDVYNGQAKFESTIQPEYLQHVGETIMQNMLAGIDDFVIEYGGHSPLHPSMWLQMQVTIERDKEGNPQTMQGVVIDISEHKQTEGLREESLDQVQYLYDASKNMSMARGLDNILTAVVESIVAVKLNRAYLLQIVLDDQQKLERVSILSNWKTEGEEQLYPVGTVFPAQLHTSFELLLTREPFLVNDMTTDERLDETTRQVLTGNGMRSAMVLPLFDGDTLFGGVLMESRDTYEFGEREQRVLSMTAAQLSSLVQNELLLKAMAERAQALATVAEVATAVTVSRDPQMVLKQVVDLTKERFGFYHAHIYQLNQSGDTLQLVSGAGEIGDQMVAEKRTIAFDAEQSLVARAARTRKGVIVNDVTSDPNFLPHPLLPETKAEMAVPMVAGEMVLGVLDVQAAGMRRFDKNDAEVLTTLASQVAVALQNAEQYKQVQTVREQLSDALDIAALAYWELDLATGNFLFSDDFYERILHTTTEEAGGNLMPAEKFATTYMHPDDGPAVAEYTQMALDTNDPDFEASTEVRYNCADGKQRDILMRMRVVKDAQGNTIRTYGTNQDITEQKAATQALEQANAVVEQSPVIVFRRKVVDNMLGDILYVSENVQRYGYTAEDFTTGRVPFEQTVHPDDLQFVGETLIGNLQNNIDEYQFEYRGVFPGDVMTWFTLQATIERDEKGEAVLQVGTIIDITELKQADMEREIALSETQHLYEVSRRMSTANGLQEILSSIAESEAIRDVERIYLLSIGLDKQGMVENVAVLSNWDKEDSPSVLPIGAQFPSQVYASVGLWNSAEPWLVGDVEMDDRIDAGMKQLFLSQGMHSAAVLPLLDKNNVPYAGVLLESRKSHHFSEIEQRTLGLMSRQLSAIVQNELLLKATAERAQALATVAEVSTAVTASQDPQTVLKQVVDLTKERFGFYHAHVYQLNEAGDMLELVSGAGEIGDQMVAEGRSIAFDAEQSLVARAARTKEGVIVNDVTAAPNFLPHPLLPDTKAELAVPMLAGDEVLGVLDVQASGMRRFGQDDVDVLTTLASQAAVALQNAEQYAVIQQANKVIEQSPVIVYRRKVVDNMLDRILYVSDNVAQYGYRAEDFTSGRVPFEQTIHPDDLQMVGETLIGNLQKNIDEYELEYRGLFPGDRLVWFSLQVNIERDEEGVAVLQSGTFIDITEIKEAQFEREVLLAETQSQYETSRKLNTANGYADILNTVVGMVNTEKLDRAFILGLDANEDNQIETLHIIANWDGTGEGKVTPVGTQFPAAVFPVVSLFTTSELFVFNNFATDERLDEAMRKWLLGQGLQSGILLPLLDGDRPFAAVFLESKEADYFTKQEERAFELASAQLNSVVQNELLLQATAKRARELATVAEVGTAVSTVLESEAMLQQVVDLTKERFELYHAHIYLLNGAGDTLELRSGAGEVGRQMVAEKRTIPYDAEQSLVARTARTKEGVIVNDVAADPNFLPHPLLPNTKAEMAVPLIVGNRLLGVLDVQSDAVGRFSVEDVRIQTTLASQVAVALQNTEQYNQVRQSEALVRNIIDSTSDWIFVKDLTHRYVMANQGYADTLHIAPEDFIGKNDIELGFPEELVKGNPERGIRGFWADDKQVFETKEPIVIERDIVQVDGRERIYSTLKTPLMDADGNVTGVLVFARDVSEREELLQETRAQAEQEALINAISQKIQATTSVESALQVAIRELGDSLGAEKTSIRLGVDAGQRIRK